MNAMRFAKCIRAELIKLTRRPAAVYTALFVVVSAAVAPLVMTSLAYFQPERYRGAAQWWMAFPLSLQFFGYAMSLVAAFPACILAADLVGSEYRLGTWSMIVPRAHRRSEIVLAKALLVVVLIPVVFGVGSALYTLGGFICCHLLSVPSTVPLPAFAAVGGVAVECVRALFFSLLAFAVTVLFRSTIFGVAAGLVAPLLLELVTFRQTSVFLPNIHLTNLQAFTSGERNLILDHLVGFKLPFEVSVGILMVYVAGFLAVSVVTFARRDIAGA